MREDVSPLQGLRFWWRIPGPSARAVTWQAFSPSETLLEKEKGPDMAVRPFQWVLRWTKSIHGRISMR
jgi:hypothetical protein